MSDNFTRPRPGDDALADRLRALGDRYTDSASLPPVEEIHHGGDRRRRNQRIATAGAAFAVAAIIGGAVIASQLGDGGDETLLPATPTPTPSTTIPEATPTITTTGSPTATTTPLPTTSTRVTPGSTPTGSPSRGTTPSTHSNPSATHSPAPYPGTETAVIPGSTYFTLPAGWTSVVTDYTDPPLHHLCVSDGTANDPDFPCDLRIEAVGGTESQRVWRPGQRDGWEVRVGTMHCPVTSIAEDWVRSGVDPTKSLVKVGMNRRTMEKYTYKNSCTSGAEFTTTLYWQPDSQIRITDFFGNARTKDILGSFSYLGS